MLEKLVRLLTTQHLDLSETEIADSLWLSRYITPAQPVAAEAPLRKDSITIEIETGNEAKAQTAPISSIKREAPSQNKLPIPPLQTATPTILGELHIQRDSVGQAGNPTFEQPFNTPEAPPLSDRLKLGRALRPLSRRLRSRHRLVLDDEGTVDRIAETDIWLPVLKAGDERWLSLSLIIVETPAMHIWKRTITAFAHLLSHHGAFRAVDVWTLVVKPGAKLKIRHGIDKAGFERPLTNLRDHEGRRVLIIITDGVAEVWSNNAVIEEFQTLGRQQPLVVLQLLPEHLWDRTILGRNLGVKVRAPNPASPNNLLGYELPRAWSMVLAHTPIRPLCLPVMTLEPDTLAPWARFIALGGRDRTFAYLLHPELVEEAVVPPISPSIQTALNTFLLTASRRARRLAALFTAAAPLTMRVMRIIQQAMLPESQQVHLAEVLLSGLLIPNSSIDGDLDDMTFQFVPEVRERLRTIIPVPERIATLEIVGNYIGKRLGLGSDFRTWLRTADLTVDDGRLAFARLALHELRGLQGSNAQIAQELSMRLTTSETQSDNSQLNTVGTVAPAALWHGQLAIRIETGQSRAYQISISFALPTDSMNTSQVTDLVMLDTAALRVLLHDPNAYARALEAMLRSSPTINQIWEKAFSAFELAATSQAALLQFWFALAPDDPSLEAIRWESLHELVSQRQTKADIIIGRCDVNAIAGTIQFHIRHNFKVVVAIANPRQHVPSDWQDIDTAYEVLLYKELLKSADVTMLADHPTANAPASFEQLSTATITGPDLIILRCQARTSREGIELLFENAYGGAEIISGNTFIEGLLHQPGHPIWLILLIDFGNIAPTAETITAFLQRLGLLNIRGVISLPVASIRSYVNRFVSKFLGELVMYQQLDLALSRARDVLPTRERWLPTLYAFEDVKE